MGLCGMLCGEKDRQAARRPTSRGTAVGFRGWVNGIGFWEPRFCMGPGGMTRGTRGTLIWDDLGWCWDSVGMVLG